MSSKFIHSQSFFFLFPLNDTGMYWNIYAYVGAAQQYSVFIFMYEQP
jgi:hypothetical protein